MGQQAGAGADPHRPGFPSDLLKSARYAPLWLVPRVVLGWLVLQAGWGAIRTAPGVSAQASSLLALVLTLCGVALILGLFTAPAALVAGSLSTGMWADSSVAVSAAYLVLMVVVLLPWRTAGWIGLDRWVLPLLGLTEGGALVGRSARRARQ